MATVKISALPTTTTPADADVSPLVQSGVTKAVSWLNIKATLKTYFDTLYGSGFTTGDVKLTLKTAADSGWVLMNDGSIGDASSGGTTRANADTSDLFTLLWNNTVDADCPVSTGRGASAAADFAAHKKITLPLTLGRALANYGTGAGLTARALAHALGAETQAATGSITVDNHTLTSTEMPAHTHSVTAYSDAAGTGNALGSDNIGSIAGLVTGSTGGSGAHSHTGSFTGSASAIMQPTLFLNTMIKL